MTKAGLIGKYKFVEVRSGVVVRYAYRVMFVRLAHVSAERDQRLHGLARRARGLRARYTPRQANVTGTNRCYFTECIKLIIPPLL